MITINNYFGILEKNYELPVIFGSSIKLNSEIHIELQTNLDNVNIFLKSLVIIE